MVINAHGTIRFIPAVFAAWSSFFCCRRSCGPMALIRISMPDSAEMRSASLDARSMGRILIPSSWILRTDGLSREAGRTKISISYVARNGYSATRIYTRLSV